MNWAMILGVVGIKPRLIFSSAGMLAGRFSIVTDESFITLDGKTHSKFEHHFILVSWPQAKICPHYLDVGSQVIVEGSLEAIGWRDKQGKCRHITAINTKKIKPIEEAEIKKMEWAMAHFKNSQTTSAHIGRGNQTINQSQKRHPRRGNGSVRYR